MICRNISVRGGESCVAVARERLEDLCRNDV